MDIQCSDKQNNHINSQAGLTLVELLVAMAITVFIGFVIFELFSGIMGDWNRTTANTEVMANANIFLTRLGQDIRLAKNPNSNTKAVVVSSDNSCIDVYRHDETNNHYQRISYLVVEVNRNGQTINCLTRGMVETTDPGNDSNPQYGIINDWQILIEGLDSIAIFYDRTENINNDRRLIEVIATIIGREMHAPQFTNIQIRTSFMSRSQQLNSISGEGGSSEIAVSGITVSPSTVTDISKNGTVFSATAQVSPSNATNQKVSWSTNQDWIIIDDTDKANIQVTITPTDSWRTRPGTLTAISEDGGFTAAINVSQDGYWSW